MQHDDLHHHNVFRGPDGVRVLDWGDTSIAHPFFSTVVTFRFLEEHNGLAALCTRGSCACAMPTSSRGVADASTSSRLAERVGIFAHAIAGGHAVSGLRPREQAEFDVDYPVTPSRCALVGVFLEQ